MRQVLEAVQRVRAAAAIPQDSRLSVQLDPDDELGELESRIHAMRESRPLDGGGQPSLLDIDFVLARWQESLKLDGLSRREVRALCWDTRAVADERFLVALRESGMIPARASLMRGLWFAHQQGWRLPSAFQLESLFRAMDLLPGAKPSWLRNTGAVKGLFAPEASTAVSREVVAALPETITVLERLRLSADGNLAREAIQGARTAWVEEVRLSTRAANVDELLRRGVAGLLAPALVSGAEFRHIAESLLLLLPGAADPFKDAMREWIVQENRLGHPRRRSTSGNWVGMSEEARQAAVRLFAARDLRVFFDILIGNLQDYQHRRTFWEQYVESPQLVDFAVACDWEDKKRLRANLREGAPETATLLDAPVNHSAFIMRFQGRHDVIVAEMSQANNAMYLFDTTDFEDHVGDLDNLRFKFRNLKDRSVAAQFWAHTPGWQERFASKLWQLGIRRT